MTEIIADDNRRGHVDWASILAGAAIAAGAWVVFTSFTAAIGLGSRTMYWLPSKDRWEYKPNALWIA